MEWLPDDHNDVKVRPYKVILSITAKTILTVV